MKKKISDVDKENYLKIRKNVSNFLKNCAKKYDRKGVLLDIAPQIHEGAAAYFRKSKIETLDIDSSAKATYTLDICRNNSRVIANDSFELVVCTEVIEHTLNPFAAITEIYRVLKPGGFLFLSTPFNFRIHGPLPDCWRFTEHGLKELLKNFEIKALDGLDDEKRFLMPIHYTVIARK